MCLCAEIVTPREYTALSGDLQLEVMGVSSYSCVQLLERSLYQQVYCNLLNTNGLMLKEKLTKYLLYVVSWSS